MYIYLSEGNYIQHYNDTFRDIYYLKEFERGFMPEENLAVSGRYEVEVPAGTEKTITFVGSLEDNTENIDGEKAIEAEIARIKKTIDDTGLIKEAKTKALKEKNEFIRDLLVATDTFIIDRPAFKTKSILARISLVFRLGT